MIKIIKLCDNVFQKLDFWYHISSKSYETYFSEGFHRLLYYLWSETDQKRSKNDLKWSKLSKIFKKWSNYVGYEHVCALGLQDLEIPICGCIYPPPALPLHSASSCWPVLPRPNCPLRFSLLPLGWNPVSAPHTSFLFACGQVGVATRRATYCQHRMCLLCKSNQIKSSQIKSSQAKSNHSKPNQINPNQITPSQVKPSRIKSNQSKPNQIKSNQINPSQVKPSRIKSNQIKSNKPNQIKPNNQIARNLNLFKFLVRNFNLVAWFFECVCYCRRAHTNLEMPYMLPWESIDGLRF